MEAGRKKLEHRKAQYKQTLKDMGATEVVEGFQEGEVGGDKEFKALDADALQGKIVIDTRGIWA